MQRPIRVTHGESTTGTTIRARHAAIALAALAVFGCSTEHSPAIGDAGGDVAGSATGALFVKVEDQQSRPIADAVVITEPATRTATTDSLGTVLLRDLPPATYIITASHAIGNGRGAAVVLAGAIANATVRVRAEVDSGAPRADGGAATDAGAIDGPPAGNGGILAVTLAALAKDTNGIDLSWSSTAIERVTGYRIYRAETGGAYQIIGILSDPGKLTFRDDTIKLGVSYSYRVGALTRNTGEVQSNVQTITAGVFIDVMTQVTAMKTDRTRPYLYAIDSVNNSLLFVNTTTNTLEKTIFVGSKPQDLDVDVAGTELYIANFGATQITVVNLDTREQVRVLNVDTKVGTWDGNPYRLACTTGDTLVFTSQDQWNDVKLVDAKTGTHLSFAGSFCAPSLAASPDGTRVYVGGDGLTRLDVVMNKLQKVDNSDDRALYGSNIAVSGDGKVVYYGARKILTANLKSVLGTVSEPVLLTNHDGTIAVGAAHVFDGTTFGILATLPLSTTVMAMSSDAKTLYLYDTKSSRIYLYGLR
jgi:DNA-binding beta-propeller fold protein YncE